MSCLDPFKIDLRALPEGITTVTLMEDDAYFTALEGSEVRGGCLRTVVTVNRLSDLFELTLHTEGTVTVACDLCLDDMEQLITVDDRVVARLGDALSEEDDVIAVERGRRNPGPGVDRLSVYISRYPTQARACTWKMQSGHDEVAARALGRPKR